MLKDCFARLLLWIGFPKIVMIGIPYSRIIKYQKNTMARHVLWLLFGIVMRVVTSHRAYTFSIFVLKIVADEMAQIHKTMCSIYKIQRFSVKKEEKKKRPIAEEDAYTNCFGQM